ncbi:MAG: gamma-glutamyltransferase, partial [Nocardioides sp.]
HDINSVTIPGCVDGWLALHRRFGTMDLAELLDQAARLADHGFRVSPGLARAVSALDHAGRRSLAAFAGATRTGARLRLPALGRTLRGIGQSGRAVFYQGEFGAGLRELGGGLVTLADLECEQADWASPLSVDTFGVRLHTPSPNSQGYLTLGSAALADQLELPADPGDPQWAHLLIECATAAGHDRPALLHEDADGARLLRAVMSRGDLVDPSRATRRRPPTGRGDTTYLGVVDQHGTGVSLIQSNAGGLGAWLAEPNTGINLHNRGIGFSLTTGHPAEYGAGRRPPSTLAPLLITRDGALMAVLGAMGGDAQPQILLQLLVRLLVHGDDPARAISAGRWVLTGSGTGFDTWDGGGQPQVQVEGQAPSGWDQLLRRGHRLNRIGAYDSEFGHAQAIVVDAGGVRSGFADPRTVVGSCAAG